MSVILSADDLNDFISPGVACIKPVETLPPRQPLSDDPYEVTTEDKLPQPAAPAQISLTDCLACSGCVTSAEAVLVSLQSHSEVLNALDSAPAIPRNELQRHILNAIHGEGKVEEEAKFSDLKVYVASVSPQVRASLAATYGISEAEAGFMIEQLLSGPQGLGVGGKYGNQFAWAVDTNVMRTVNLHMGSEEVITSLSNMSIQTKKPILTSACPGWICYAEKTHPHVLPHLSRLKSPQALAGTFIKTVLSKTLGLRPDQIWHLAVMPCFDKKLEASRQEFMDTYWREPSPVGEDTVTPIRDVDCVITARELLMLADSRGISFPALPRDPIDFIPFPDLKLSRFLLLPKSSRQIQKPEAGTSGGYLHHILSVQKSLYPGSIIQSESGRNSDVMKYKVVLDDRVVFQAARYYGFRNIQNLVRKLKPLKASRLPGGRLGTTRKANIANKEDFDFVYVEVMACPGGCTNGGGQIKISDLGKLQGRDMASLSQKEWLHLVDEAYYSQEDSDVEMVDELDNHTIHGISSTKMEDILSHWSDLVGIELEKLIYTSYKKVESDVGKPKNNVERVVQLSSREGGGW